VGSRSSLLKLSGFFFFFYLWIRTAPSGALILHFPCFPADRQNDRHHLSQDSVISFISVFFFFLLSFPSGFFLSTRSSLKMKRQSQAGLMSLLFPRVAPSTCGLCPSYHDRFTQIQKTLDLLASHGNLPPSFSPSRCKPSLRRSGRHLQNSSFRLSINGFLCRYLPSFPVSFGSFLPSHFFRPISLMAS